jgi:hypothetical protein
MEIVGVLIEASPIRLPGLVQFLPSLFPSRKCATAKHQNNNNEGHDHRGALVIDWIDPGMAQKLARRLTLANGRRHVWRCPEAQSHR